MIAIGVGGLDAATVMGGSAFELNMAEGRQDPAPGQTQAALCDCHGRNSRDPQEAFGQRRVGKILEYGGPGVKRSQCDGARHHNEYGRRTGSNNLYLPSDERTKFYLDAVGRGADWTELIADEDADYAEVIKLNLNRIEPMIAQPHSPDNVVTVKSLAELR